MLVTRNEKVVIYNEKIIESRRWNRLAIALLFVHA